jgi:azurin
MQPLPASSVSTASPPPAPTQAAVPTVADGNTLIVQLTGDDNMHFNGVRFTVTSGQPVRIELKNIGQNPPAVMAHNVVVLKSGSDPESFSFAAAQAKGQAYLPPALMSEVLAFTAFASPEETVQATFTAPAPGEYPFLCTFPGHFAAGMHGVMIVKPAK